MCFSQANTQKETGSNNKHTHTHTAQNKTDFDMRVAGVVLFMPNSRFEPKV